MLPRTRVLLAAGAVSLALALGAALLLVRRVDRVVDAAGDAAKASRVRALAFTPAAPPAMSGDVLGDGTVSALCASTGVLTSGGGSGIADGTRAWGVAEGLSSLRVRALASWRGTPVFALERGGWGRLRGGDVEEASTPWGRLEVRALLETESGELLVGARQGLFRAAPAAGTLERLATEPVRALALLRAGEIAAGGEKGLFVVSGTGARRVETPDPWIESLGAGADGRLWAATPLGIATGARGDALALHPRGGDASSGVLFEESFWIVPQGGGAHVARLTADGSRSEETTPEPFRALLPAGGALFGDGESGLFRRAAAGRWVLERKRPASLPLPRVNALASDGHALWAGFFDGGLAVADDATAASPAFRAISSEAWGVNALLPAGGAVWAATLQGTFRIEKGRAAELSPAGATFALATTGSGIVVGTSQGVSFPERRLLSAFHGLPGNQALALLPVRGRDALWVGTPSGLGRIDGRRVSSKVIAGEGKLPHPWVTSLAARGNDLFVATYGGGIAMRTDGDAERWTRFAETEGLKVNALAALPDGRVAFGTVGQGLWISDASASRFARAGAALPSPDVFSLALAPSEAPRFLFVGTSEGLARLALEGLR